MLGDLVGWEAHDLRRVWHAFGALAGFASQLFNKPDSANSFRRLAVVPDDASVADALPDEDGEVVLRGFALDHLHQHFVAFAKPVLFAVSAHVCAETVLDVEHFSS